MLFHGWLLTATELRIRTVRVQVTRIGSEIGLKEERHKAAGLRTEKQRHLLLAQIGRVSYHT